jgi:hypothetical protein
LKEKRELKEIKLDDFATGASYGFVIKIIKEINNGCKNKIFIRL